MKRNEFLRLLAEELRDLPESEINKSLDYYAEMIDDRIEDGMPEEEAVAALGTVQSVARTVLLENYSLPMLIKTQAKKRRALRVWEIVLLVLGAPLWIPLLLTGFIIILSVFIVIWSVIISLYATVVSIGVCSPALIFASIIILLKGQTPSAILVFGASLILAGLAILGFMGVNRLARLAVKLCKFFIKAVKSIFIGKGNENEVYN